MNSRPSAGTSPEATLPAPNDRRSRRTPLSFARLPAECALARLDVRLIEIDDRRALTATTVGAHHLNQRGQIQGGIYGVLADAVAGWATEAFLDGENYATTAISGQLFGAATSGDVILAEAEIAHGGRSTITCTVRLRRQRESETSRLIAMFQCQQLVLSTDSTVQR
jgi:uncharacterized protein (TIGR00369 family)